MNAVVIGFMQGKTTAASRTGNPVRHFVTAGGGNVDVVIVVTHPIVIVQPTDIQTAAHIGSGLGLHPVHTGIRFRFYSGR